MRLLFLNVLQPFCIIRVFFLLVHSVIMLFDVLRIHFLEHILNVYAR